MGRPKLIRVRTGALEAARREWVKAEQEETEVRRPFEEVNARLMDLRPALARAEAEVREQETLEGIAAARVQADREYLEWQAFYVAEAEAQRKAQRDAERKARKR